MDTLYTRYFKYAFDKFLSLFILLVFWWLYLGCAIAVYLGDGGPILYKQERVGLQGGRFMIYKFRSMVRNAERMGPNWTDMSDSRITPVGKFLRATSLDEIPQIFNVLLGDMSLVGYRPDVYRDDEDYRREKYSLRPGITGLAQVNGRSGLTADQKRFWEDEYTKRVSFMTDIGILCKTVVVVLKRSGSY